jgi:aspartyl-tRNA synthetase
MTYAEAMDTTGSDRPDLRFGLRMADVTECSPDVSSIFKRILQRGGSSRASISRAVGKAQQKCPQNEYAKEIAPSFGARA